METTVTGGDDDPALDRGWVLLVTAPHAVHAIPMGESTQVVIGREPGCDLVLDHERVSRRHARISIGASWTVEDLGSRNGTLVNGVATRGPTAFVSGEPIGIGPFTAVVVPRAVSAVRSALGAASLTIDDPSLANPTSLQLALARSAVSTVIHGETGTGKEVLSRALHRLSGRSGPFFGINCAAIAPQLLESELFGHEKGAFTGAVGKAGLFEAAARGTILLDEVAEMPGELQAKLLRAIETREVMRVGGVRALPIDVRFIAASHRELMAACTAGTFRRDLFYRLAGITLTVLPLRERRDQLAALATRFAREATGRDDVLAPATLARLAAHDWPGNVRELKNVMERAALLADGAPIAPAHLIFDTAPAEPAPEAPRSVEDDAERARVLAALDACAGNQTAAAKRLGISRATLVHKLDLYRVSRPRKKS